MKTSRLSDGLILPVTHWTPHHGMRPDPQASERDYEIDLVLVAKGGTARLLRVTRQGDWTAGDDAHVLGAA